MEKTLTLALIIPAYNEEDHLKACLDAIAAQTVKPDEVIVVNNNSTDNTAKIARGYKFVRLIEEKQQGLIPARNRGFASVKSDILGRLDADSVIKPNWVETVKKTFHDPSVDAVTGPAEIFIDSHFPNITTTLWTRIYFWYSLSSFRFQILWGPNMALRRRAWKEVKNELCSDDKLVHEDQDISIVLKAHGKKIVFSKKLLIWTEGARLAYLPKALEYSRRRKDTAKRHKLNGNLAKARQGGLGFIPAHLLLICMLPFSLVYGLSSGIYSIEKKLGFRR